MKIINTRNAEHYHWGQESEGWHLLKDNALSVIEEKVGPGQLEKRHYHHNAQQFFYVLSGTAHVEISDIEYVVAQGSGIHVPSRTPHQLANRSQGTLRFLVISQPMSHGDRVEI